MRVNVKLLGVLAPEARRRLGRSFDLDLHEDVTAGELLGVLAKRCGAPFCDAVRSSDPRLPRHIRLFAEGEMLTTREQTLAPENGFSHGITVVLLTPMMGG
jgi:hypothetical protein